MIHRGKTKQKVNYLIEFQILKFMILVW